MPSAPHSSWVPPGQSLIIAGRLYEGGMVYVGTHLRPVSPGYTHSEPALINPELNAHRGEAAPTRYYSAYHALDPQQRMHYLEWLLGGRRDPDADLGYVFLFFYGLERRLLYDLRDNIHDSEVELILDEVRRLQGIYTTQSFRSYSTDLIDFVHGLQGRTDLPLPPMRQRAGRTLPWAVRLKVALSAQMQRPLGANWAWAWALLSMDKKARRQPLRRAPTECHALFVIRYRERFGKGYEVPRHGETLTLSYTPASESFGWRRETALQVTVPNLVDAAADHRALTPIMELVNETINELEPFSRWLGRVPDARQRADVVTMLPPELVDAQAHPAVQKVAHGTQTILDGQTWAVTSLERIVAACAGALEMPKRPRDFTRMADVLHRVGVGIEPDPAFGTPIVRADGACVIFRRPMASHEMGSSKRFALASLTMRMVALVLGAQRAGYDANALTIMDRLIDAQAGLTSADRARLRARARLYRATAPTQSGLSRILATAPADRAHALAAQLVSALTARAEGTNQKAMRLVEQMYKDMSLDPAALHDHLHAVAVGGPIAPPAPAAPLEALIDTSPVPPAHEAVDDALEAAQLTAQPAPLLDEQLIAARQAESAALESLFGSIFIEEEVETTTVNAGPTDAIQQMLAAVREHGSREWTREQFEELAGKFGLPVDGALERLDDVAWEHAGESLFERYDPIEINEYALGQIPA